MVNLHILSLLAISHVTAGLVTLHTIREVTNITRDATAEIIGSGLVRLGESVGVGNQFGRRPGQVMLGAADDDDGEVEDVVAAALTTVNRKILEALNVPLITGVIAVPQESCPAIIEQHHALLSQTTLLLRSVHDRQQANTWGGDSSVFAGMTWMQALWASRKANEQHRSFIEQQITLYGSTGCFNKIDPVVKGGSELVEYMNDIIDSFGS